MMDSTKDQPQFTSFGAILVTLAILGLSAGATRIIIEKLSNWGIPKNFSAADMRKYQQAIKTSSAKPNSLSDTAGPASTMITRPKHSDPNTSSVLSGLLLALDREGWAHDFQKRLPKDLQANFPNEVGTILCVKESINQVGVYTTDGRRGFGSGSPANVTCLHISAISLDGIKITEAVFASDMPPAKIEGSGGYTTRLNEQKIFDWLRSLRVDSGK